MGGVHKKYSGSNAHRFMVCSMQVAFAATIPDVDTEHSIAGTRAHAVLELAVKYNINTEEASAYPHHFDFDVLPEYTTGPQHVVDYIKFLGAQYKDLQIYSEIEVEFPQTVVPRDQVGGIVDVFCYSPTARTAWVIDYKNGAGKVVGLSARDQVMLYLTSKCWSIGALRMVGVIIQPNHHAYAGPIEIEVQPWEIVEYVSDIENAIRAAEDTATRRFVPGNHCGFCRAAAVCPAIEQAALAVLPGNSIAADLPLVSTIDTARLAAIRAASDRIKAWLNDVYTMCFSLAVRGEQVPGFKLVEDAERRAYKPMKPESVAAEIIQLSGGSLALDDVMPRKLIPLTEAEKKLVKLWRDAAPIGGKDIAASEIKTKFAFVTVKNTSGKLALVPESDTRPAVTRGAGQDFLDVVLPPTVQQIAAQPADVAGSEAMSWTQFNQRSDA